MKKYEKVKQERNAKGFGYECSDCSVLSLAIVCRTDYATAHEAMRKAGRKDRRGAFTYQSVNALHSLGFKAEFLDVEAIRRRHGSGITYKTVGKYIPKGYYLVRVKGHIAACVNGVIEDWADGRKHRIKDIIKVTKTRA